jgi:trehalose-phosphatase
VRYLFKAWQELLDIIKSSERILLLLDYDGTLTPIVARPQLAHLDSQVLNILRQLSRKKYIVLGILTGRDLGEIQRLVPIKGIYFAGNHGFQIKGPKLRFVHPACKRTRPVLEKISHALKERISDIKGALLEDKGPTLSLHYRLVKKNDLLRLKETFDKLINGYRDTGKVRISQGKKVIELKPGVDWDKGKALEMIRSLIGKRALPIYLGDDSTDEDAFRYLGDTGISVFVGRPKKSQAKFYLRDSHEVKQFLKEMLRIRLKKTV